MSVTVTALRRDNPLVFICVTRPCFLHSTCEVAREKKTGPDTNATSYGHFGHILTSMQCPDWISIQETLPQVEASSAFAGEPREIRHLRGSICHLLSSIGHSKLS